MEIMLPTAADNGARLAAILPSGIAAVAQGLGHDPSETLAAAFAGGPHAHTADPARFATFPNDALAALQSFVLIVVDGLGHANLRARKGHAPTLSSLPQRRIETVAPSTTGAALTTITTGRLPGEHGLVGYRIRHPRLGLVTTLSEWDHIPDRRSWQLAEPLFPLARKLGARTITIGRPAHAHGGLTEAILSGAEYLAGQRIDDRFALASQALRTGDPTVMYLYVDELDRAAHEYGWESQEWVRRLEQFDSALDGFLRTLPGNVGVAITADHGIVDVAPTQHVLLDSAPELLEGVALVGGEPRFRSLYLDPAIDPATVRDRWAAAEQERAWVFTRDDAIAAGLFGPMSEGVAERLGDVMIAARKRVAYTLSTDDAGAHAMIGQHGSFSDEERGVPLALGGTLAGSGFASVVAAVAAAS